MKGKTCLLTFTSTLILTITVVFNVIAAAKHWTPGIFTTTTTDLRKLYPLEFLPTAWFYSVLIFIAVLLAAWHGYAVMNFCLQNEVTFYTEQIVPKVIYSFFIISCSLNITWLFLQDNGYFWWSMSTLLCASLMLSFCLLYGVFKLSAFQEINENIYGMQKHIKFVICTTYNGIGIYAAWTWCMAILHCAIAVSCWNDVNKIHISYFALTLIMLEFLTFFLIDFTFLRNHTCWILSPYLLFTWLSLDMLLCQTESSNNKITSFKTAILIISIILLLCKILYMTVNAIRWRSRQKINHYARFMYKKGRNVNKPIMVDEFGDEFV